MEIVLFILGWLIIGLLHILCIQAVVPAVGVHLYNHGWHTAVVALTWPSYITIWLELLRGQSKQPGSASSRLHRNFVAPFHTWRFRFRRLINWLPMGFAYASLYYGRYALTVVKSALGDAGMTKEQFGVIFAAGTFTYGLSFLLSGPIVDRVGGRRGMLLGVGGTMVMNLLLGLVLYGQQMLGWQLHVLTLIGVFYCVSMFFQSFGAIAIVTAKAPWFKVEERGTFGTIFGWIITLGLYFAFDFGYATVAATRKLVTGELSWYGRIVHSFVGTNPQADQNWWVFWMPAVFMGFFWILMFLWLRNRPSEAGFADFDTQEATLSKSGGLEPVRKVFWKIIKHPVLQVVCIVEFMSGVMRNGIMHWYKFFMEDIGQKGFYINKNWGVMLFVTGVIGAWLTGSISDNVFRSRRAPMAAMMYLLMIAASIVMTVSVSENPWVFGIAILTIAMAVTGVHGIFSGTVTADFAGVRNTGATVGIVDGMVYLGTGLEAMCLGQITPHGSAAASDPSNWVW